MAQAEGEEDSEESDEEEIICSGGCGHRSPPAVAGVEDHPAKSREDDFGLPAATAGAGEALIEEQPIAGQGLVQVVQVAVDGMLDYLFATDLMGNTAAALPPSSVFSKSQCNSRDRPSMPSPRLSHRTPSAPMA